jgi:DNA ligase-associated metallophosphoesterase
VTALLKTRQLTTEIVLAGRPVVLDLTGALYLVDEEALLVADLHFEKGSSFARKGLMLPPYDTRETLVALEDAVARFDPRLIVALGDSFHDVGGPDRLGHEERESLSRVQAGRRFVWVTGNHDHTLPDHVGGEVVAEMALAGFTLRHEPQEGAGPEIAGHLHPVGKVVMRGRGVRRRCFVTDGTRMVMPALGAYAGGLNACDPAFRPLFPGGFTAHLIGTERIFAIARPMLCRD